jgi:hypothetical protein
MMKVLAAVLLAGCVSSARYRRAEVEIVRLQNDAKLAQMRIDELQLDLAKQHTELENEKQATADLGTGEKLDRVIAKIDELQHQVDQLRQQPPPVARPLAGQPDPLAVYAVPIDGDPSWGPATAKVTLVEAADFA